MFLLYPYLSVCFFRLCMHLYDNNNNNKSRGEARKESMKLNVDTDELYHFHLYTSAICFLLFYCDLIPELDVVMTHA